MAKSFTDNFYSALRSTGKGEEKKVSSPNDGKSSSARKNDNTYTGRFFEALEDKNVQFQNAKRVTTPTRTAGGGSTRNAAKEARKEQFAQKRTEREQAARAREIGDYVSGLDQEQQDAYDRAAAMLQREKSSSDAGLPEGYRKAGLKDLTWNSLKQGYYNAVYGQESFKDMYGDENEKARYEELLQGEDYRFVPQGGVQEAVSGAANLLGQQVRQWTDPNSVLLATGAATAASLAGKAGPQIMIPEEIITVPAAFAAGIKLGSSRSNFEIEAGSAYNELIENGVSADTAKKIATGVGGVNAALEFVQLDELFKSFKILKKSGAAKNLTEEIGQELLRRGIDVASETAQEVAQEGATIAGAQLGQKLESGNWQYTGDEVKDRLLDTARSSALSFAAMNVPGAVNNTLYQVKNHSNSQTSQQDTVINNSQERQEQPQEAVRAPQESTERQGHTAPAGIQNEVQDGDRALLETAREMVQDRENGKDPLTEVLSGGKRVNQEQLTQEQMEAWDTHNDVWVDAKDNVYQMDPTQHISQRTFEGVGDRKVNAFQFDHPELQSYYKQAAEQLVRDASLSIDAPKTTRVERGTQGKRYIHEILDTPSLRSAMDMGLSRNQVIQAAQDLIADNGQENNAAAKRLEFVLDDMLTRGYMTAEGESFGPNAAYISAKETIPGYQAEQREALPIWDMEEAAQAETAREQDVQQRMKRVRRAAGALGESGGKALTAAYTEDTAKTIAPKEAVEGFYKVYNAALKGEQLADTDARSAAALPAHLRYAAQSAGQQDALRAKQAQFFGEKAGLVKDDSWKKAHLSSKTDRTLDALGKALGVQIRFAETVADGQANGQYVNGTITLALDGENPVMTTVTHEAVHRLREMSPEAYSALADFVRGNLSEETADYALLKREVLNQSGDVSAMTEEMVADAFGRVLNDGKAIERLVQDDRSLAEKVRDVLADIVNAVKRVLDHQNLELTAEQKAEFRELEGRMGEMERLFSDALGKAALQTGTGNGTMNADENFFWEGKRNGRKGAPDAGTVENLQGEKRDRQQKAGGGDQRVRGELSDAAGRYGRVNPTFGAKPVRTWAEGHTVEPARGSVAYTEQQTAMEYGVPSFVVADEVWAKNKGNTPAFSADGQIYLRETLPERNRGMYAPHEVTHVMKQVGYQPYLDFVERTPTMLNMSDPATMLLLNHVAEHLHTTIEDADPTRLYDEFNATMYGHIAAGKTGMFTNGPAAYAFHDFDSYVKELTGVHEQFKAENEKGKKFSLKEYTAEEKKQHVKDAAAYFGRTFKWAETGYITTDGKRLDFSGRHDGGPGGYRTVDHRDIRDALGLDYGGDDYSGAMVQFMGEGNIRISPESGGINLSVMPTKAQLDILSDFISKQRGEVILDLDTPGGDTVSSTEYPRGTHANKVLADIKAYFEEGKQPQVSEVSRFRYSLKEGEKVYNKTVVLEENTVDTYLKDYASKGSPKYAQAYITYMSPNDFVALTTSPSGRNLVEMTSKPLDAQKLGEASRWQPIQLHIDHETGEVTGHEGRHRATAMQRAGIRNIPVLMFDKSNKYSKETIGKLLLHGQDFGNSRSNASVYAYDLVPLNYENRDAIVGRFSTAPANEKNRDTLQYSRKEKAMLEAFRKEYGTIPKGETPSREILLPRKTAADKKVSQTVRTILEAGATPEGMVPTVEDMVAKGDFSYEAYSDKKAISDAESQIKKVGWAQALTDWTKAVKSGEVSKANTAMGWALYNNAANSGDTKTALTVLNQMVEHQRSAAQALQATRILKSMSPETQLYGAQRSVENLQEELNKRYGDKKGPELKIDEDLAKRFMKAKDQESRDELLKEIYRDIGRQMPSRFIDRWNAWRYLAMLGNTRTHVRNIVGNAGFVPVVAAKNLTATAIESAVYRVSGGKLDRSKALVGVSGQDRALLKAAWGDYAKVQEAALGGGKYSDFANANQYVEEGRKIFGNTKIGLWNATGGKALETFRKANSAALDMEDVWFSKPHYAYALSQYCKAHNITAEQIAEGKGLKAAREYAVLEAQKATYRDTNAFSQTISDLGRGSKAGKNKAKKAVATIMEGILPFRKTPANILARGVEYSPIGLVNGIKEAVWDVQKGTKTGAEAIDAISAGLSGTGLLALGLYMAAQGLVRGHGGDDDKKKKFEELQGHQAYALELPNGTSVTLNWLAPEALPFFIGVNLWEESGGERATLSDWMTSVKLVTEPLLEMSCLQSLNDVFDAVGYAKSNEMDGLPAALASAATSYLTQALPTVLGQAERTGEDKRYTTYTEKNAFLTGDIQYTLGKASARIPGWDYQQIPYIDAWGRTEASGNAGTRAFNNFVDPAYTSQIQTSEMEKELLRLYEATGEGGVFPKRADKYFTVDQERKDLTAQEYVKYATLKGQSAYQLVTDLVKDKKYQAMSDQDKAAAVENAYKLANQQAKQKVGGYEPESWIIKAAEAEKKHGIDQETYVLLKTQTAGIESLKDKDGDTISNSKGLQIMELVYGYTGLSDKQKEAMFEYLGVGKTIRHYNPGKVKQELEKMKKK